ncbi:MAG: CapA family protein [Paludibacter sp.]|nr:CapA family protein [Paludibacter sp.]
MKKYIVSLILLLLFSLSAENEELVKYNSKNSNNTISLFFAGDVMCHLPQFNVAYNSKTYNYNFNICFSKIKPYIEKVNLAIANFEGTTSGKPYTGYPNFSCPDEMLDALKYAGFGLLLNANNHVLDRGKYGLQRTIYQIQKRKLLHIGSYINKNQRDSTYPLIVESKGIKLAFLNCTYGTNEILASKPNSVNYIDTLEILADLKKANDKGADLKIVTVHWGTENELLANKHQRNLANFLVKHGVNLIIGSHPHVVQNSEILYGKDSICVPVFYSLGNFISNQRNLNTNGGIMVKVDIDLHTKQIINTSYLPVYVYRGVLDGAYQYHLIPTPDFLSNPSKYSLNANDSLALIIFDRNTKKRLNNSHLY